MTPNPDFHAKPHAWTTGEPGIEAFAGQVNMWQLIQLRWIAVVGQITTITIATLVLGIRLPVAQMSAVLACLIAFNIGSQLRFREGRGVTNSELFFALLVDIGSLTAQLYFSGGTANPFVYLYLLQVILSAVLLESWTTWVVVAITSGCLAGLAYFSVPLQLPPGDERRFFNLYVEGMLICFVLNAGLLVFFINRINANLRAGDAQLAELRQRAAEEEHIVRMGLLASGAAHELGTPLATLSVILGDWKHMPEFKKNPALAEEIAEMQTQLQRCKTIVSGILLSAGEARGESSVPTTLNTFLDDLAEEWQATRPSHTFVYRNHIREDVPVAFDSALKQMISNVLDNALEASPQWVGFDASRDAEWIRLTVTDKGPGFPPAMLANLGKPYQSSKGRPGGGLGLFLVVNVARKLGGTVSARNHLEGGAVVDLVLPLAAIALPEGDALGS
ncbi:HAMP domain-containing histidine kinase [Oxalobacteraceae bacterium OM1]|nr:HAMP domain-containing histidine kinase [Oxalobacteraceae bacterium OM1]